MEENKMTNEVVVEVVEEITETKRDKIKKFVQKHKTKLAVFGSVIATATATAVVCNWANSDDETIEEETYEYHSIEEPVEVEYEETTETVTTTEGEA